MVEDDTDLKDSVQRLHRYIVDALSATRGDAFSSPVTVSEIYQEIAPYRAVRNTLGFEMNADYEHALVRMLSGLDGLTRLDPSKARERLRKELDSPNPDVTVYRDYAACDVVLNPPNPSADWVREQLEMDTAEESPAATPAARSRNAPDWSALSVLASADNLEEEDEEEDVEAESPDATHDSWADPPAAQADTGPGVEGHSTRPSDEGMALAPMTSAEERPATTTPTPSAARVAQSASCGYCDSKLPHNRQLRYCPFCGADQSMQPCPSCGEPLEPDWSFCIACGTAVASGE
jgi:hypothetical protein